MGVIVAYLLLIMEEEDAFWTMVAIMEDLMPATYYTANIPGIRANWENFRLRTFSVWFKNLDNSVGSLFKSILISCPARNETP
jgi:hypothetical protein